MGNDLGGFICFFVTIVIPIAVVLLIAACQGAAEGCVVGILFAVADIVADRFLAPNDGISAGGLVSFAELWFFACVGTFIGGAVGRFRRRKWTRGRGSNKEPPADQP